jgi:hypothetical protein
MSTSNSGESTLFPSRGNREQISGLEFAQI